MLSDGIHKTKDYKIAAIYGSPRRSGNTDELLNKFLEGLNSCKYFNAESGLKLSIEKIMVSGLNISSCRECRSCSDDGACKR